MRRVLRWLFAGELRALQDRLEQLERAELERERVCAEQLEQLRKYWARLRTRDSREASPGDSVAAKVLQMKFPSIGG